MAVSFTVSRAEADWRTQRNAVHTAEWTHEWTNAPCPAQREFEFFFLQQPPASLMWSLQN